MLTIRPEQMAVFQRAADAAFVAEVVEYLLEHHADVNVRLLHGESVLGEIPSETLHTFVRNGIARARLHGLTWESSLLAFVVMMFVAAPNFDEHPLILRAMKAGEDTPDERFERVWDKTTEENWEAASRRYNPGAWDLQSE